MTREVCNDSPVRWYHHEYRQSEMGMMSTSKCSLCDQEDSLLHRFTTCEGVRNHKIDNTHLQI